MRIHSISGLIFFFLLATACGGPKDVDKIAEAQNCLDTAAAADADACVAKVDGIESSGAYLIRCAGKFVKEGFNDPSKLSGVMDSISGDTGADGSTAMMAALAFKAEATTALNSISAQQAFDYCTAANSKGLILLAGLSQTASVLGDLGGDADLTGPELKTLMGTKQNDPVAQEAVGTAVTSIYTTNCLNNNTTSGAFCEQFASAVATVPGGITNTTELGKQIMICYNDPTATGCTGF